MIKEEALKIAKPILFNTEMVRAIQNGTKTVTRRVIKSKNVDLNSCIFVEMSIAPFELRIDRNGMEYPHNLKGLYATFEQDGGEYFPLVKAPYEIGDILYIRETWAAWSRTEGTTPTLHYKADGEDLPGVKWRPSIHMPKEAARIFLRVTDVRVELLQDITITGLQEEGILLDGYISQYAFCTTDAFEKWQNAWDSTLPKSDLDKYGWAINPWVWVIEFERIEVTG